ncbi:Protein of uncharacterised function (DUF456) [Mycolicibacterium phlei]|jgi:uncharacterized protein YqgC (DUF456 family)|uniref:Membrane protein n=1 Tax=Mycolicibacterium phlei DSM 43239 = CCUG 21000 TaxID=1226750 RepID=A0A5N5UYC0_MYCPH|nr:DUF456 domain-containing protein [Mycolicibacterium phlei]VEG07046.1 Protein of uncharacterised function (DUF456) [Mycobacteroides chelonae]AMO58914.1 hypothetical protein MPHLCCUG_00068 [Mycolicibacterium phlei]KAB7754556.1 membrane protein [Mycolicibacterium phlei DSM 43239 = CCUG 21000]KXW59954.1 membrane protein [Mycolicibacterium phlei DSM 43070]KXW65202.1 membrane protein [Mycolicibacterium phlei DSM 43239 = CCUG 21000]
MSTGGIVLVALAIAIGIAGIIVPLLPGTLLVFAAIAVWAFVENTTTAWITLAVIAALLGITALIKYTWPVRRMRDADVRTWILAVGAAVGVVGFFVIPVLGLPIGFVLGIYLAELASRKDQRIAWASTKHAVKGVALSVGVELTGALLATVIWAIGVYLTQ